ncbi:MAG: hypothetical protein AB7N24_11405 [Dehalococcoidia bacterium]
MKLLFVRALVIAAVVVSLLAFVPAALAQENGGESHGSDGSSFIGGPDWTDVKEVTIWSIVSIAGGAAILGVLYLFKRKVGGFPENPAWVAPITIMPASELPGDDVELGHGEIDHGSHAPAH